LPRRNGHERGQVTEFKDHFSQGAAEYSAFRPAYPNALFEWLAAHTSGHDLAWDCATGNGQAARGLARHYTRVIATDASATQLEHAPAHPRIHYRVAPAEHSGLPAGVDLVTVAQALHWLPLTPFFAEVQRVLAPGGLIAVWGYGLPCVSSAALDQELERFYHVIVGPYWPPEREMVDREYRDVPFPFLEVEVPRFSIEQPLTRLGLEGYLRTWSATQRYRSAHPDDDPLSHIASVLVAEWPHPQEVRLVRWPMFVRAGHRR
jgi:SAM-dependent methyltransferase